MARLVGVDLPRNKRMEIALTYIYGIGPTRAKKILDATGNSPDLRTDDLTEEDIRLLRNELSNYNIEGDLRREITMNIKRLQEIGSEVCVTNVNFHAAVKEQRQMLELNAVKKLAQFLKRNKT